MAHLIHVSYFPTICTIKKNVLRVTSGVNVHTCVSWLMWLRLVVFLTLTSWGKHCFALLQPTGRKQSGRKNKRGLIYKPIHGLHKEIKEKEKRVDFHLHRPRWSCREPANPCSQRRMINDGPAVSVTTHINQLIVVVFMQATRKMPEISSCTSFWKHSGLT